MAAILVSAKVSVFYSKITLTFTQEDPIGSIVHKH